ncbi:MAG TPA: tRNA uridine(34) 5-carboxymethylaminomethyl modification radical SAM/GNAT enzyme Elp3 [Candidatus Bathyarchaeia archaeon]|nr:tRNA uridine(34) 5-carboxymethylaminomethyl modification radical SAM/GNAT enzyme Elp3 [Candidatus Bathyarchaeia archaeon]
MVPLTLTDKDLALREIINILKERPQATRDDLNRLKMKAAAKYKLEKVPSNSELISLLTIQETKQLIPVLRRKTTRTISGVTIIATMTKPYPCPQSEPCAYCPGGPSQGSPQSYTGHEPAAMRGAQNNFDPYLQVQSRIEQLTAIGHNVDKIELIVMGGTFPATPQEYQTWFIQRCLDAITGKASASLEEAKANAETSRLCNVGITVETRPDWAKQPQIDSLIDMGVTRIELGVQNPDDSIYRLVGRTHTVSDVQEATRIAKDAGLKIVYHMMPGLPGSSREKDIAAFRRVFNDPAFKPDMVKIYPCLCIANTKAYEWYQKGDYKPYTTEEASELVADVKRFIPPWIRVMRVQRDIPSHLILAGVKKSNLRQLATEKLKQQGVKCQCIRCREVGHRLAVDNVKPELEKVSIQSFCYDASEGKEVFISVEDRENDVLLGYLRLRVPSAKAHRAEVTVTPSAIVRELHVYGPLVPVGKHLAEAWQHKGFGADLLKEAERMARDDFGLKKLLVISALGTRRYYMRFGYRRDGVYVSKHLVS